MIYGAVEGELFLRKGVDSGVSFPGLEMPVGAFFQTSMQKKNKKKTAAQQSNIDLEFYCQHYEWKLWSFNCVRYSTKG